MDESLTRAQALFLMPVALVPIALAWHRALKGRAKDPWGGGPWLTLTLQTVSTLWLLIALSLGVDFSTRGITVVWLNVFVAVMCGLANWTSNHPKHIVTLAAGSVALTWFCALVLQSSV